jgi:hypothetical protein
VSCGTKNNLNEEITIGYFVTDCHRMDFHKIADEYIEFFADSTSIGIKGQNKVTLSKYIIKDSCFTEVKFYAKSNNIWRFRSQYTFGDIAEPTKFHSTFPEVGDYNKDGLQDFVYTYCYGARATNAIKHLFIYDKDGRTLKYVKNSEDYPNLWVNDELHCINSDAYYGGCCSHFLKIDGDSLKEFANVELYDDSIYVREYDNEGKAILIYKDSTSKPYPTFFKSYNPLIEAGEDYEK